MSKTDDQLAAELQAQCPFTQFRSVDEQLGRQMMNTLLTHLKGYSPSDEEVENRVHDVWTYINALTMQAREVFMEEGEQTLEEYFATLRESLTWIAYIMNARDGE